MKKILPIILIVVCNTLWLFAQPSIQWQKCLGGSSDDLGYSIQQTNDGGYIIAGYTNSNDGDVTGNHSIGSDYWIVKLSSLGSLQWQKCLGGTGAEIAYSIQQTTDGGFVVAGTTSSNDGNVTGNHGSEDYWIVKLNSIGSIQWQKCFGGTLSDAARSIQQTSDGGYVVAGNTFSSDGDVTGFHGGGYKSDYWVVKLNSSGVLQWQKCLGGTGVESANYIQQTSNGGYIVAGFTESNNGDVTGNHGDKDYWVVKLNSSGVLQWQECYGGTDWDDANLIQLTSDGGYIIAGYTLSNDGDVSGFHVGGVMDFDYWVVKLNSSGVMQWQKCLGGTDWDMAYFIQQTSDGSYIVAGYTQSNDGDVTGNHGVWSSDFWAVKLNSSGVLQWQKSLGGSGYDEAHSIQQTSDGGYVVTGSSTSNDGDVTGHHGASNYPDYWVVKLNSGIGIDEITNPISNLQVTPNPVSQSATISFSLSQSENLSVTVYDITGRLIKKIFTGNANVGNHELKWNVSAENNIEEGVYYLNIVGAGFSNSSKIVVLK